MKIRVKLRSNLELKFYNSLGRKVEVFKPIDASEVKLYCCGPTVYNYQHIGNLRTYIFEDILTRVLRYAGYNVQHVMNITDVGHLVSDGDEGEDKMLVAARREKKRSHEIADYYTEIFLKHCSLLNIVRPNIVCKATDNIKEMIALIERLVERDFAYFAGGNVYFDVDKFERYGEFAQLDLNALRAGARIDVDQEKRGAFDFALWFTKSKFENQELLWESPWGLGYPGWHIECSAMAMRYLGESFDIHCGGIDHVSVHHTNEIAQSECATGKRFSNYWMHGGFLVVAQTKDATATKMSKSSGEFLTLDVILEKGFDPLAYRLFCLSASYRNELAWSWNALEGAANSLKRIKESVLGLSQATAVAISSVIFSASALELRKQFQDALADDLSMPRALAVFHELLQSKQLANDEKWGLVKEFDQILGLGVEHWAAEQGREEKIPAEIIALAEQRKAARIRGDWSESDRLRAEILEKGYAVRDNKEGYELKRST